MKVLRCLAILMLVTTTLVSGGAFAARVKKIPLPPQAGSGYQNKPIAIGAVVWYCAYGGATEILCRLGDSGNESMARPTQKVDPRLPPVVGDILNHPQRLARGHVSIPLLGDPVDFELVGQLAEAVMCGSNPSCGVVFAETPGQLQILVASFESTRGGPVSPRVAHVYSLAEADH